MMRARGFTILEAVITIAIFTIILVPLWTYRNNVFRLNTTLQDLLTAQRDARQALKVMTREMRSMSPSSTGAYALADAQATTVTFYGDIDDDGLRERIRYFTSGTLLQKGTLKPTGNPPMYDPTQEVVTTVVRDIANGATPIFEYYDRTYDGTTAPLPSPVAVTTVRLIKITAIMDRNPNRPPGPITVTTQVSFRNLKDNL